MESKGLYDTLRMRNCILDKYGTRRIFYLHNSGYKCSLLESESTYQHRQTEYKTLFYTQVRRCGKPLPDRDDRQNICLCNFQLSRYNVHRTGHIQGHSHYIADKLYHNLHRLERTAKER